MAEPGHGGRRSDDDLIRHLAASKFGADREAAKRLRELSDQADRLTALIDTPYHGAWLDEVMVEAGHQRKRFGDADDDREPQDWYWLLAYLAGKALRAHIDGDADKARHHTVSTAAVCQNWAAHISGDATPFRPRLGASQVLIDALPQSPAD